MAGIREAPQSHTLLGLPDPDSVALKDPALHAAYRAFCASLTPTADGSAILSDGPALGYDTTGDAADHLTPQARAQVQLLIALYHPNAQQTKQVLRRVRHIDNIDKQHGSFYRHVDPPYMVAALREWREFAQTADYRLLSAGTVRARRLCSLHMEFSGAPGITWFGGIEVSRFSPDWAVVLYYPDAEELPTYAFPRILGFARINRWARGAGAVLADERNSDYAVPWAAWLTSRGCGEAQTDLLKACWTRYTDAFEGVSYSQQLLALSDADLAYLRETYGSLASEELITELIRLDDLCATWGGTTFATAVAQHGPLRSVRFQAWRAELEARERRAEEEAERKARIAAEERQRRQREEQRQIREAQPRGPREFPADRRLNDLTAVEVASLQRWMTDVVGVTEACIERRRIHPLAPPTDVYIDIVWTHAGQRHAASFGFSVFPTVREALRDTLRPVWSDEGQ